MTSGPGRRERGARAPRKASGPLWWAAFLLMALAGTGWGGDAGRSNHDAGVAVPGITMRNAKGDPLSVDRLAREHGAVVVNFWGIRCGSCIEEIPSLNEIQRKFAGSARVLGVNVDGVDADLLKKTMDSAGIRIEFDVVPDPEMKAVDAFGVEVTPLTLVVGPDGIIAYAHEGYSPGDEAELETHLQKVLSRK